MAVVRFGAFEFRDESLELKKGGLPVKLGPQPACVLKLLIDSRGEVVSRDRIQEALWPSGTHVEFELGLNAAVNRLRRALNDSADQPRYIETLPRVGYRFIADVEVPPPAAEAKTLASALAPSAPVAVTVPVAPRIEEPDAEVLQPPSHFRSYNVAIGSLLAIALGMAAWIGGRTNSGTAATVDLSIALGAREWINDVAVSPLGDHIAYTVNGGERRAYRRFLKEDFSRRIAGSDGALRVAFSPDGLDLAFTTDNGIRVVAPDGRTRELERITADFKDTFRWGPDGSLYYVTGPGSPQSGVWSVPADGSKPPTLVLPTTVIPAGVEYPLFQSSLGPGSFLYTARSGPKHNELRLRHQGVSRTLHNPAKGGYVGGGMLVYEDRDQLVAEPFDPSTLQPAVRRIVLTREAEVRPGWSGPMVHMNPSGMLAFVQERARTLRRVVWVDRATGAITPTSLPPSEYEEVRLSPVDPSGVLVVRRVGQDLWHLDLVRLDATNSSTTAKLLLAAAERPRVAWAPDGKSLAVSSEQENGDFPNLYRLSLNVSQGSAPAMERLTEQPLYGQFPCFWRDGELVFQEGSKPQSGSDVWRYSFRDHTVRPVIATAGWDVDPALSPDGRVLVYASGASSILKIFERPYPTTGGGETVRRAIAEGRGPVFVGQGTLVFSRDGSLWEISRAAGSQPRLIAHGVGPAYDYWTRPYDVAADGSRVLSIQEIPPETHKRTIRVIRDVAAEYRKLVR